MCSWGEEINERVLRQHALIFVPGERYHYTILAAAPGVKRLLLHSRSKYWRVGANTYIR